MIKRLLLAALLLWAATLIVPGLGEAVQARAASAWAWTSDRLERPASPFTDRYRRVQAESDLQKTSRQLVLRRNAGHRAPEPQELAEFMAQHQISEDGIDPWGTAYRLVHQGDTISISSAGPDLTFGTDDDVTLNVPFPSRGGGRR
jgi:hypothetical protein